MVVTGSSVKTQESSSHSLSTWAQAVLLLLIVIGLYFQTWIDIWPYWENKNATYTHGTLVALVAIWLAWRERSTVNLIEPMPNAWAALLVVLLSAIWLLAEKANLFIVYATLWPIIAFVALWAGIGFQAASRFAFPLSFLYFAIPIWDYLKPPLQAITSTMASLFTSLFGIPAVFDGPYATLPTGTIFIAEDCSGAHFLCVALAVGVLAGVLRGDGPRTRILILAVAGLLSMAFNWLRIMLIVLAYLHPDLKHALESMGHLTFGWWVFALDLVVFSLVLRFVPRSVNDPAKKPPPDHVKSIRRSNSAGLWISTTAIALLPAIAWALPRFDTYSTEISDASLQLSAAEIDLVSPDPTWQPRFEGADWQARLAYLSTSGRVIEVYGNEFRRQSKGKELISSGSSLFESTLVIRESSAFVELGHYNGSRLEANRIVFLDRLGNRWVALYTYVLDQDAIATPRLVQFVTAFRSIYSRPTAGVLAVATLCRSDCTRAGNELADQFVRVYALQDYTSIQGPQ